jgi:hypothetical protein
MKLELKKKLMSEFPTLYTDELFDLSVGDGWFDLLHDLSKKILEFDDEVKVLQIKEKFGTLRFYTTATNDAVYSVIREAEKRSSVTCENCGDVEDTKLDATTGWAKTLCLECREKTKREHEQKT